MPIHAPELAGKPYRPSNGTEGERFMEEFCYRCKHHGEEEYCPILVNTMIFDIDESGYPDEWRFNKEGIPECMAFEK